MVFEKHFPRALVLVVVLATAGQGKEPVEPLLRDLAPGVFVSSSTEVTTSQTEAIGKKLGGRLRRVTNSIIRIHGQPIQVNVITAQSDADARGVYATLQKFKSPPLCQRNGPRIIEYVGRDVSAALATKTSYELGVLPKPVSVKYRVVTELATVEDLDYMACNPLFNRFLALQRGNDKQSVKQIRDLTKEFAFGRSLVLRHPSLGTEAASYAFQPPAIKSTKQKATIEFTFDKLPDRYGVPYTTVTMDIAVGATGFHEQTTAPAANLVEATAFWPSDDPAIVTLARDITVGKQTNHAKVTAILEWLSPGRHVNYSGQTGSRWGTAKVLEQKFGRCWDFSDCFVTLARAAGVPSRQVAGWFFGSGGHVWAEYYREGDGWQQVDPTGGGKLTCGIYHIPYFTSEDGRLPILYLAMPRITW